ncbi:MAG: hypothetical protein A3B08_02145 [Candidatus Taylorbacteria bacterium RIFCSPLOWO2_01_FULL_43_44]|uniref:Uncharacterized protein n=1 Tax=Candidatus Taylorbacteria bacterium RIFCSPHIGHO2_02_FULL_43_32b TaxID=1802306 RepID=A0A1G2MHG0_9BACT|nr:MAG: hypothetical protein A2743_04460 [Candidatus Taylorbacteria bacterium RIFCSPHIGHO2_01_FULL_43_47]OHA23154.1 MAG: hypothetical protein A3C72_01425 [Candidatus Taylorbacteria bacterium RIFCSPHIGHO2_02_FULL_43_32b]OHA29975.1 MAG: hypothetical protein A3B08_02145 [Candidatus Taylorbacteria bacterium RIFCSPLOWO2_01_FULL_43_44]
MSKSLFIGRYQPFHDGHKALIDTVLKEGKPVVIAVRDTPLSEKNPYPIHERVDRIKSVYKKTKGVEVIAIPDITEVCYGRDVGWSVRQIRLENQKESISATKIRNNKKRVIWLTGNTGSGKSSLAYLLKDRLNAIVLDGDEMRASISSDLGFSKEEREEHNLRVARLAKILNEQGHNVVVSVIAPFRATRAKITKLINPYWIYIKGGKVGSKTPYEIPKKPDLTIDPTEESLLNSLEKVLKEVGGLKNIATSGKNLKTKK